MVNLRIKQIRFRPALVSICLALLCSTGTVFAQVTDDIHGDTRETATTIQLSTSLSGRIEPENDTDYFRIDITESTTIAIFTTGNLDAFGILQNSSGTNVMEDDDSGLEVNFLISASLEQGTYYIAVTSFRALSIGDYTLHVLTDDDHGNTPDTATPLRLDTVIEGIIAPITPGGRDIDYFEIKITEPTLITIFTTDSLDTLGVLQDDTGQVLETADDEGEQKNFLITRNLPVGTYYITVRGKTSSDIGAYVLYVDVEDHGRSAETATPVELNTATSGTIIYVSDVDYFEIEIREQTLISIFTTGDLNTNGVLLDSTLNLLDIDNNGGKNNNFLIHADLEPSTYYIVVGGTGFSTPLGDYILHVLTDDHRNTTKTSTTVGLKTAVSGTIEHGDDIDYFKIEITESTTVEVFTTGNLDTIGELFSDPNISLAVHDQPSNFLITSSLDPGIYYIEVSSFGSAVGDYVLHVRTGDRMLVLADDHGNAPFAATNLLLDTSLNTSVSGTIGYENDIDYFRIEIMESTLVSIFTTGNLDTVGTLYDGMNAFLQDDNQSGTDNNFLIRINLDPGTYYIKVNGYGSAVGDYVLHVNTDDYGNTNETATLVPLTLDVVPAELSIVRGNTGQITVNARTGDSTLVLTLSGLLNTTITLGGINDEVETILQATIEYSSGGSEELYEPIEVEGDLNEFRSTDPPADLSAVEAIVETIIDSAFWNDTYNDYQPATITMSVTRLEERASADIVVTIIDDSAPSLNVEPKELYLEENTTEQITVSVKNIKDGDDIKVMLTGLAGIEATTNTVILNADMLETTITLKAMEDFIYTGTRTETIMLKAEGYASVAFAVNIIDNEMPTPLSLSVIPPVLNLERDSTGQIIVNAHVENRAIVLVLEGLVDTTITLDGLNNEHEVMLMAAVQYSGGSMDIYPNIGKVGGDLDELKSTNPPIDLSAIETVIETIIDSTFWDDTYNDYQPATIIMSATRPSATGPYEQVSAEFVVVVGDVSAAVAPVISLIIPSSLAESTREVIGSAVIDVKHGEPFPVHINVTAFEAADTLTLTLDGPQNAALPTTLMTSALSAGGIWTDFYLGYGPSEGTGEASYRYCQSGTENCSSSILVSYSPPAAPVVDVDEISSEWDFTLSDQTATNGCMPGVPGTFPTLFSQEGNIFTSTGDTEYTGIVDGDSYSLAYRDPNFGEGSFIDTLLTQYSPDPVALSGPGVWWWTDRAGFLCRGTYNIRYTPRPSIDSITADSMSVSEDTGNATITITLTHPPVQPVVAMLEIEGTATAADYAVERNINFGIGEKQTTLNLVIVDDSLVELDETIILKVVSQDSNKLVGESSTTLTIVDNDVPAISFEQAEYTITEGTTGTITLKADQPPVVNTQVQLTTLSATIDEDDYRLSTTVLVFEPGQSTASFAVSIFNDDDVQLPRELRLSFDLPDGNALRETPAETVIRINDNAVPIAGLAVVSNVFSEAAASVTLRVTLDRMFAEETSITIVIDSGGTATRDADYTINTDPLVLPANRIYAETILTVDDDDRVEGDETIELSLNAHNDLIVDMARLTLTIADNDVPAISFERAEYTIAEGTTGTVILEADQPPVVDTRIELTTLKGTTVADGRYSFPAEIVFEASQTTVSFEVGIVDDDVVQSTQELSLSFDLPDGNAEHGATSETVISVENNDTSSVTLTVAGGVTTLEEGATAMLRITLTHAFDQDTSITIVIDSGGTATRDTDYRINTDPLVLPANSFFAETTLRITIDDDDSEPDETIILTLDADDPLVMGDGPDGAKLTLTIGKAMLFFRIKVFLEGAQ